MLINTTLDVLTLGMFKSLDKEVKENIHKISHKNEEFMYDALLGKVEDEFKEHYEGMHNKFDDDLKNIVKNYDFYLNNYLNYQKFNKKEKINQDLKFDSKKTKIYYFNPLEHEHIVFLKSNHGYYITLDENDNIVTTNTLDTNSLFMVNYVDHKIDYNLCELVNNKNKRITIKGETILKVEKYFEDVGFSIKSNKGEIFILVTKDGKVVLDNKIENLLDTTFIIEKYIYFNFISIYDPKYDPKNIKQIVEENTFVRITMKDGTMHEKENIKDRLCCEIFNYYKNNPYEDEHLYLIDAGLADGNVIFINLESPVTPLLRKDRNVDFIIMFDNSEPCSLMNSYKHVQKENKNFHRKEFLSGYNEEEIMSANKFDIEMKIMFFEDGKNLKQYNFEQQNKNPKPYQLFKSKYKDEPTVLYLPLMKHDDHEFKNKDVKLDKKCNFPNYDTFMLEYSHDQATELVNLTYQNLKKAFDSFIDELKKFCLDD
jgi:hypothetical protein